MGAHGTMRTANQRCWGFHSRRRVCELPANLVRTSAPQSIARGEGTRAATSQAARRGTKAKTRRETKLRAGLQIKLIGNQAIRAIIKRARTANRGLRNCVKRTPIPELSVARCCAVAPVSANAEEGPAFSFGPWPLGGVPCGSRPLFVSPSHQFIRFVRRHCNHDRNCRPKPRICCTLKSRASPSCRSKHNAAMRTAAINRTCQRITAPESRLKPPSGLHAAASPPGGLSLPTLERHSR